MEYYKSILEEDHNEPQSSWEGTVEASFWTLAFNFRRVPTSDEDVFQLRYYNSAEGVLGGMNGSPILMTLGG